MKETVKEFSTRALLKELLTNKDVVFLDTETTGVGSEDEVVELSVVSGDGNCLFDEMFKPNVPMTAEAEKVSHITDDMLKNKPTLGENYLNIKTLLNDKILVGWNIDFDIRLLKQTASSFNETLNLDEDNTIIDLMKVFGDAMDSQGVWLKQDEVQQAYHWDNAEKHRALDDVLDMVKLCEKYVEGAEHDDIIEHVPEKKRIRIEKARANENNYKSAYKEEKTKKPKEPSYKKYLTPYLENKKIDEIAKEIGVQSNTVKYNLYKAMDAGETEYKKLCEKYEEKKAELDRIYSELHGDDFISKIRTIGGYKYKEIANKLDNCGAKMEQLYDYIYVKTHNIKDENELDDSLLKEMEENTINISDEQELNSILTKEEFVKMEEKDDEIEL